jgi:hypothetical protein
MIYYALLAPNQYNPNQILTIGDGLGLFVYSRRFENTPFHNSVAGCPKSKPCGSWKLKRGGARSGIG